MFWLAAIFLGCSDSELPMQTMQSGRYLISLPEEAKRVDVPAVIYFHGHGASVEKQLGGSFERFFVERGYAVVLAEGQNNTWSNVGSPSSFRDEFVYTDELRTHLLANHPVDPTRLFVTGFSQGSSVVWDLACSRPGDYAGFAPASGTLWLPYPAKCVGPAHLRHTHGLSDTVFPLQGRSLGRATQGSTYDAIALLAEASQCRDEVGDVQDGVETCQVFGCQSGSISLCTYEGKHKKSEGWNERTYAWFESVSAGL